MEDLGYEKRPAMGVNEEMWWRDVWRLTRIVGANAAMRSQSLRYSKIRTHSWYLWKVAAYQPQLFLQAGWSRWSLFLDELVGVEK
jgi:hypothetical protein